MDELLGAPFISDVIDRDKFEKQINELIANPHAVSWEYAMNIVNLAILAQLPYQSESSIEYESSIMNHVEVIRHTDRHTNSKIREILNISSERQSLHKPISLSPNCSITRDLISNVDYIVKDGSQEYELDEEYPDWKEFLLAMDGKLSAIEICEKFNLDLERFRSFLDVSIEEEIIVYSS